MLLRYHSGRNILTLSCLGNSETIPYGDTLKKRTRLNNAKGEPIAFEGRKLMKYLIHTIAVFLLATNYGFSQDSPKKTTDAAVATDQAPLDSLRWMIGEWGDQSDEGSIKVKCVAYGKRGFLKREFKLQIDEENSMEVVQMIGYDPVLERVQSWTFDTEGGYGTALWSQEGNRWTIKTSFQLASGETASSTNIITKVDDNTVRWKSVNRQVGGQIQPSVAESTFVRKKAK